MHSFEYIYREIRGPKFAGCSLAKDTALRVSTSTQALKSLGLTLILFRNAATNFYHFHSGRISILSIDPSRARRPQVHVPSRLRAIPMIPNVASNDFYRNTRKIASFMIISLHRHQSAMELFLQ